MLAVATKFKSHIPARKYALGAAKKSREYCSKAKNENKLIAEERFLGQVRKSIWLERVRVTNEELLSNRMSERESMDEFLTNLDRIYSVSNARMWFDTFNAYPPMSYSRNCSEEKFNKVMSGSDTKAHLDPAFRLQLLRDTSVITKKRMTRYISKFVTVSVKGEIFSLANVVASYTPSNQFACAEYTFDNSNLPGMHAKPLHSESYLQWAFEFNEPVRQLMTDNGILYKPSGVIYESMIHLMAETGTHGTNHDWFYKRYGNGRHYNYTTNLHGTHNQLLPIFISPFSILFISFWL